jgi:16S rRNA (adenine1518-N6/adenine1519-N6)-dimethyltransferase
MQQKHIPARKSLGQNFLQDRGVIRKIVSALNLHPEDAVLEIGCGTGALTRQIIGKPATYIGVEIDTRFIEGLRPLESPGTVFLNQNILELELEPLCQRLGIPSGMLKVVGNLPYYISSPVLQFLADNTARVALAVVMLQAEVANRLSAVPGTKAYGVLTVLGQYYFEIRELLTVSPRAFRPAPKVYSKLVQLTPRSSRLLPGEEEPGFFRFIRKAFSQRRKTLRNSLQGYHRTSREALEEILRRGGHSTEVRTEALGLPELVRLYQWLKTEDVLISADSA